MSSSNSSYVFDPYLKPRVEGLLASSMPDFLRDIPNVSCKLLDDFTEATFCTTITAHDIKHRHANGICLVRDSNALSDYGARLRLDTAVEAAHADFHK